MARPSSRETAAVRHRSGGWVLRVGDYYLWSPDRAEVVRAAGRLRNALAHEQAPEVLAALRRSCEPVMD